MVVSCQEEKSFPIPFCGYSCYVNPGQRPERDLDATFDQPDIRGLGTARPVFVAELPLSTSGSSVILILLGATRVLLTWSRSRPCPGICLLFHQPSGFCSLRNVSRCHKPVHRPVRFACLSGPPTDLAKAGNRPVGGPGCRIKPGPELCVLWPT